MGLVGYREVSLWAKVEFKDVDSGVKRTVFQAQFCWRPLVQDFTL